MSGSSSDVEMEMARLVGAGGDGDRGGRGAESHDDEGAAPAADRDPAAPPLGSGISSGGVLRCVLSFACGTFAVAALLLSATGENPVAVGESSASDADEADAIAPPGSVPWTRMRWRPVDGDDNCVPGFRLANATIHCGAGVHDAPLSEDDEGRRYCGGVRMEPGSCVLPREGVWRAEEGERTASPLPRRFGIGGETNLLPRCETMDDVRNGTWEGPTFDQEWVPRACAVVPLSPFAWTEDAGCRTTITMVGDSHIRNLFTAAVNGLRGAEAFAEAHSTEAQKGRGVAETYEWRWNRDGSASDRAAIHRDTSENEVDFHDDCACRDRAKRCLRIVFIWAPSFREQMDQFPHVRKWNSDLIIVEPGNSYEHATVLSPRWTSALDDLLRESEGAELGMLHFAWGEQPVHEREEAIRRWIADGTVPNRKSYLLQSDLSSPEGTGLQGRATWHFACGLGQEVVRNDKIAAAEPCTDLSDTAQLRALITVHFDALSNGG